MSCLAKSSGLRPRREASRRSRSIVSELSGTCMVNSDACSSISSKAQPCSPTHTGATHLSPQSPANDVVYLRSVRPDVGRHAKAEAYPFSADVDDLAGDVIVQVKVVRHLEPSRL